MPTQLLLVEDDAELAGLLAEYLERHDFRVRCVADGRDAVDAIQSAPPDLLLLDLMLPGLDGLEVCRRVRERFRAPILMMTARTDDVDEILGLEAGADDYVKKPVEPRVLLARIRASLRRQGASAPARMVFGPLIVDRGRHEARRGERDLALTTAEFELLWLLCSQPGTPLSRDTLHQELRGVAYDGVDRSIDLRVSRLRKKLGAIGEERLRSVRGVGYLWASDA